MKRHERLDLRGVRTISVSKRPTKVRIEQFAPAPDPASPVGSFDQFLPDLLAGSALRELIQGWVLARAAGRPAVAMLGGHVVKTGVQRPLISLMEAGAFSAIAMNGAAAIHDFEIAFFGSTSEPVEETLLTGQFGLVEETPVLFNQAVNEGAKRGLGMGEALGEFIMDADAPHVSLSLLAQGVTRGLPVTVHVAIGTDTIHQHPSFDPAATGTASHADFLIFAAALRELEDGVVLNFGSAVVMPEVFLKALSTVRNLGHPASRFLAASFDQIRHYRPEKNVLERPLRAGGKGFAFVGPHELWIPLLAALYLGRAQESSR
jgi:hypothetical protein